MNNGYNPALRKATEALRKRYLGGVWETGQFPEDVAETVLDSVPDGYRKRDGKWLHPMFDVSPDQSKMLGEWANWDARFPFTPSRKWRRRAKAETESLTIYDPPRIHIHNRFIRIRRHHRLFQDEYASFSLAVRKGWPHFRGHIGSIEWSLVPIRKNEWRIPVEKDSVGEPISPLPGRPQRLRRR